MECGTDGTYTTGGGTGSGSYSGDTCSSFEAANAAANQSAASDATADTNAPKAHIQQLPSLQYSWLVNSKRRALKAAQRRHGVIGERVARFYF